MACAPQLTTPIGMRLLGSSILEAGVVLGHTFAAFRECQQARRCWAFNMFFASQKRQQSPFDESLLDRDPRVLLALTSIPIPALVPVSGNVNV